MELSVAFIKKEVFFLFFFENGNRTKKVLITSKREEKTEKQVKEEEHQTKRRTSTGRYKLKIFNYPPNELDYHVWLTYPRVRGKNYQIMHW